MDAQGHVRGIGVEPLEAAHEEPGERVGGIAAFRLLAGECHTPAPMVHELHPDGVDPLLGGFECECAPLQISLQEGPEILIETAGGIGPGRPVDNHGEPVGLQCVREASGGAPHDPAKPLGNPIQLFPSEEIRFPGGHLAGDPCVRRRQALQSVQNHLEGVVPLGRVRCRDGRDARRAMPAPVGEVPPCLPRRVGRGGARRGSPRRQAKRGQPRRLGLGGLRCCWPMIQWAVWSHCIMPKSLKCCVDNNIFPCDGEVPSCKVKLSPQMSAS